MIGFVEDLFFKSSASVISHTTGFCSKLIRDNNGQALINRFIVDTSKREKNQGKNFFLLFSYHIID